jgi:hypothetical protein
MENKAWYQWLVPVAVAAALLVSGNETPAQGVTDGAVAIATTSAGSCATPATTRCTA